jgi:hypothetical protein
MRYLVKWDEDVKESRMYTNTNKYDEHTNEAED